MDVIWCSLRLIKGLQLEETQWFTFKKISLATDYSEDRKEDLQVRDDGSLDKDGSSKDDDIFSKYSQWELAWVWV